MDFYEDTCGKPFIYESNNTIVRKKKEEITQGEELLDAASFYASVIARAKTTSTVTATTNDQKKFCQFCKEWVSGTSHQCTCAHIFNKQQSVGLPQKFFGLPPTNVGYRLLKDVYHWNERSGLGKDEQGILFPLKTIHKLDRKGLGAKTKAKSRITHTPHIPEEGKIKKKKRPTKTQKLRISQKQHKRDKAIHHAVYAEYNPLLDTLNEQFCY